MPTAPGKKVTAEKLGHSDDRAKGLATEPDVLLQLQEALFMGKFMRAINASLNPNDVCAIAARVLYEHVPYVKLVFTLSEEFGSKSQVFSPRENGNPPQGKRCSSSHGSIIQQAGKRLKLMSRKDSCGSHSFRLPDNMGTVEIYLEDLDINRFSSHFVASVTRNFAHALKNSLEFNKVKELAMRDSLTGLYNRRVFDEIFAAGEIQKLAPLSLLLIDVDNFKGINDTFGHSAGDEVLATFATVLKEGCRGADLVARYGGEEFAVILPSTPSPRALEMAERLRLKFASTVFAFEGAHVNLTVSIGIACAFDTTKISIAELVQRADEALYSAKRGGKNRACVYSGKAASGATTNSTAAFA